MLVAATLQGVAKRVVQENLETLETILYAEQIVKIDTEVYQNAPIIIKGCSHKPVPPNAYLLIVEKLQIVAKSLLFGEACSSVPLFKKNKK